MSNKQAPVAIPFKDVKLPRFKGNKKGISLTVVGNAKFKRVVQHVSGKTIYHYL